MTDKVYTQQELKEMADQLLAADDKKKAGRAAAQKAEEAKPTADKALEEKLAKCPAAALLAGNEKLRELFIKGKKKGRLEPAELSEVVDPLDLDGDQMDRIYDSLADLGIDIVTEDFTNDIPEDMEPAMEEIAEIEEEELVDPNTLVDSFNIDDPVRMYLKEIGKVPLLTGDQEVRLATAMSAGNAAKERLAQVEAGELTLTDEELAQAKAELKAGEKAKKQLVEANLRLVVSIAKRYVGRGMLFLLLTGGEPLIRKDFRYLLTELKKMGLLVSVNSNGSLIDRDWLDFFRHEPPFRFNITLYGGSEETYERLCGRPMFGRVTENIRALRQLGIGVKLNASMTPYNVADMEAMQYSSLPPVTPRISRTRSFI